MIDTTLSPPQGIAARRGRGGLTLLPGTAGAAAKRRHDHLLEHDLPDGGSERQGQAARRLLHLPGDRTVPGGEPGSHGPDGDLPGGTELFTKYRTASVAQNGPDVMGMWSGSYMLGVQDFLEPLAPYFTAEERERITGWEATSADFRADSDQIYGVPAGSDGTSCFFYNKELLTKRGVDPEASWPASFDGSSTMLGTITESGVTPMALDENAIIWQILSWWQAQMLGGADQVGKIGHRRDAISPTRR